MSAYKGSSQSGRTELVWVLPSTHRGTECMPQTETTVNSTQLIRAWIPVFASPISLPDTLVDRPRPSTTRRPVRQVRTMASSSDRFV